MGSFSIVPIGTYAASTNFHQPRDTTYDLGFIDLEQKTLQPLDNPFGPGLSPMS